jgi:hypothetical protein
MPEFLIKTKITSYLTLNCANREEARAWVQNIVATLEDQDGNPVSVSSIVDFVAEYNPDEVRIELVDEDTA